MEFWLNAFPNGHFSVRGIVGRFNQEQKEALARIAPERLLLETGLTSFGTNQRDATGSNR